MTEPVSTAALRVLVHELPEVMQMDLVAAAADELDALRARVAELERRQSDIMHGPTRIMRVDGTFVDWTP